MILNEFEPVKMFRTVVDVSLDPKPKQAHMIPDLPGWEAWYHVPSGSVYVKTGSGRRAIITTGNLAFIELFKEDIVGQIQDTRGAGKKKNDEKKSGAV